MDMDCSATANGWFEFMGAFLAKDGSMNFLSFFFLTKKLGCYQILKC
jgi:hypothetical protein